MSQNDRLIQIRTRKLGILIKDARIAAHQTVQELAQAIGISPEKMQEYEDGITPIIPSGVGNSCIPVKHTTGTFLSRNPCLKPRNQLG